MQRTLTLKEKRENYLLQQMSSELDISDAATPLHRYCISSTPRSGSTLISRMLLSSQLAGDPKEYFSPLLIQAWLKLNQKSISISSYMEVLKSKRTSQNGYFGIKVHGRHLDMLSKKISAKEIYSILDTFDKFIFISRKDKINQSISYHIARTTGVFHADQEDWLEDLEMTAPSFDAGKILRHLSDILKEEEIWEDVFKNIKKPVYRIFYEDLIANYESKSKEIFDFLEINIAEVPLVPTRPMKKEVTSEYRRLLLQKMGLSSMSN